MRDAAKSGVVLIASLLVGVGVASPPTGLTVDRQVPSSPPRVVEDDYLAEDVHFPSGRDRLAGTLYRPAGRGPHPAVTCILGSGPADRAYGGVGPALGKHFARRGFACLVWDKPGVGGSTGDYNTQTFRDRAREALSAVAFLRGREGIDRDRVGLWGHSQGGMVAPLAASLSADVAFLIEVSGWQGPAWRQDQVRVESELKADGFGKEDVATAAAFSKMRMDLIRRGGTFEDLDSRQAAAAKLPWFDYVHRCDRSLFDSARLNVEYDTSASWEAVRCPVLAIYGDKDTSTGHPDAPIALIREGLTKARNRDVTVRVFVGADHSLCLTGTGGRREAAERAKNRRPGDSPDFAPGYLEIMTDWLAAKTADRR